MGLQSRIVKTHKGQTLKNCFPFAKEANSVWTEEQVRHLLELGTVVSLKTWASEKG